jgi:flagellar hook-length control protein FliK
MTASAAQTTLTAPDGRKPIPGGREPIPSGAPPGAPPEGAPFQSALDAEWARTATAEGQQQSHLESPSPTTSRNTLVHSVRRAGADASSTVPPTPSPSGTAVAVAGAGVASSAVPPPAANDPAANVAAGVPHTPTEHDAKDGASGLPAATELEGSPADAKGADTIPSIHTGAPPAGDSTPIAESPALPAPDGAAAAPVGPDSSAGQGKAAPLPPRTAAAGATLGATVHTEGTIAGGGGWTQEGTNAGGGGWSSQASAHRPAEQQGPRSAGAAGAHDKLWVPDPAQASPGADAAGGGAATGGVGTVGVGALAAGSDYAPASATPGADAQGPLLDYGVGLQQAIETLHGTIQLAARQGLAQARIALEPEGLGEIRIHLTQTAQGLLARVTAETPAAAQALAAAHAELRQSLSSLGLNLARLSVGRHGHSAQGGGTGLGGDGRDGAAGSGEASSRGARSGQTAATAAPTDPAPDTEAEAEEDAQPAPAPAHGTLVDVLA